MNLMLTNDDGIDAEGFRTLVSACRGMGNLFLVAPIGPQSGVSHRVTTGEPIRITELNQNAFAIHGTPADCTRLGLQLLVPNLSWVISGINHGGNLGADVYYSGTVAAVREAVLHGKPGIALSHYKVRNREYDWNRVGQWAAEVIAELLAKPWEPGTFWNVNFPHLAPDSPPPQKIYCPLDPHPLPLNFNPEQDGHLYQSDYHNRRRSHGHDVDVCFSGNISISLIKLL